MPATRADLFARLAELGIETQTFDHEPVFTVAESRAVKGSIPGGHTKNLFLKDRKDRIFLVVAEGDAAIDLKRIHELIGGQGRVSFGKPELLWELLGVTPGSVTALAVLNDTAGRVKVVIDAPLFEHEIINCHPLLNDATTSIRREDLVRFLKATGHDPLIVKVSDGKAEVAEPVVEEH